MPPAMHFVLSKPELIEAILLRLPMRDLLVHAQLVNKDFHSVITKFPSLQRKPFFVAKPAKSTQIPQDDRGFRPQDWEINTLLGERFTVWFKNLDQFKSQIGDLRKPDRNRSKERTAAYAWREASWRRMLVTQPPITSLAVVKSTSARGGTSEYTGEIFLEDGIKMGLLFDLTKTHIINVSAISSFALWWHILLSEKEETVLEAKIMKHHITLHVRHTI
jgi:hypothetical protein